MLHSLLPATPALWKYHMKPIIKIAFAIILAGIASGCSTTGYRGSSNNNSRVNNLDDASRENHNSLLPASFYESNHEFSS